MTLPVETSETSTMCVEARQMSVLATEDICPVSTEDIYPVSAEDKTAAGHRPAAARPSVETGQMSSVETGQMSAVETGQMSAALGPSWRERKLFRPFITPKMRKMEHAGGEPGAPEMEPQAPARSQVLHAPRARIP